MRKKCNRLNILKWCFVVLLLSGSSAIAQQSSGGVFAINHHTIDSAGVSQGGQFSLSGTIGQADAGSVEATGSQFSLRGGFWSMYSSDLIFRDSFEAL